MNRNGRMMRMMGRIRLRVHRFGSSFCKKMFVIVWAHDALSKGLVVQSSFFGQPPDVRSVAHTKSE